MTALRSPAIQPARMALLALTAAGMAALAGSDSPVGLWKTISDTTGRPAAIVEISESHGTFQGRIVQLLEKDPAAVCDKCNDARKDQPVVGMVFLSGLKPDDGEFSGGEILDPANGKVYRARMKLVDGGSKLDVRGYIGISLLGRTQTWLRER
jgi:uncharacterized protein (DUF2147 family)